MSIFDDIFTGFFGGGTSSSSEKSIEEVKSENLRRQEFIEKSTAEARGDVKSLFPEASRVSGEGFQGAMDLIASGVPQELSAFQQGNIGAQEITAETLPLIMQAILGTGSGTGTTFDPRQINVDPSFLAGQTAPVAGDVFAPNVFDVIGGGGGGMRFPSPINLRKLPSASSSGGGGFFTGPRQERL